MHVLKTLREAKGLYQKDVADAIGVDRTTYVKYERGSSEPSFQILNRIATFFNVSVDYLLGRDEPNKPSEPKGIRIPVLGDVAAGIPIEAIEDIVDYEEIDAVMASSGEFFGLRIKGSSMEPRMREGDVVIVRKQDTAETGDTVVVMVNGDSATVKKIKIGPEGISLIPTNPAYDPMFYTAAEVAQLPVCILGKVIELRAKY